MDHEEYLKRVKSYIKTPTKDMEQQLADFTKICSYVSGQYDKDESFMELNKHLEELEKGRKESNRVFYMALPPSVFTPVSQHLKKNCYPKNGIARIIVRSTSGYAYHLTDMIRSRNHSERIWPVPESCRRHWSLTGTRMRSSVSTIIWVRRWSRIS
jgi:glucose-6-phosphate 1-dehydrogenase